MSVLDLEAWDVFRTFYLSDFLSNDYVHREQIAHAKVAYF